MRGATIGPPIRCPYRKICGQDKYSPGRGRQIRFGGHSFERRTEDDNQPSSRRHPERSGLPLGRS